jgi:hypothetical protein
MGDPVTPKQTPAATPLSRNYLTFNITLVTYKCNGRLRFLYSQSVWVTPSRFGGYDAVRIFLHFQVTSELNFE